jgi:predicted dithiol-disulfide oxidoreductase (DUF899 family)
MTTPRIVSQEEWLKARQAFLAKEKEFTRARTSWQDSDANCLG